MAIPSQSEGNINQIYLSIAYWKLRAVHRVLDSLTSPGIYRDLIKLPTSNSPVPDEIRMSKKFFPWFKDCLGAIDGTHIPMHVPEALRAAYRNRKGDISQNVLAATTMDMRFVYVLPGWEGSAADSRIFDDAHADDFTIPEGRYYLADAGYPNCDVLLVPYRSVRYHLKEWGRASERYVLLSHDSHLMRALIYLPQATKLQGTLQFQACTAPERYRADFWCNEEAFQDSDNPPGV